MISKILYFLIKNLAELMTYSFFKEIEIIGTENLPEDGPVILCGTHNSQYVDGMMLILTSKRPVNFLIAEKSTRHKLLKHFVRFMNVVPVTRAIDHKKLGNGQIRLVDTNSLLVKGSETAFTDQVKVSDSLRISIKVEQEQVPFVFHLNVQEVLDQETVRVKMSPEELLSLQKNPYFQRLNENEIEFNTSYYILPKINQKKVFQGTLDALAQGKVIGIFPEGGSHDQTKLIDIKPGACIFQYKYFEATGKICPVIPVGLNYFGSHKFRSKVVINVGAPIESKLDEAEIPKMSGRHWIETGARPDRLTGRLQVQASQGAVHAVPAAEGHGRRPRVGAHLSGPDQPVLPQKDAACRKRFDDRRQVPHFQEFLPNLQEHPLE